MDFTQDQIQEIGLSEEQVTKLTSVVSDYEANLKKSWDGKANEQAEGILNGAALAVEKLTGIKREHGQKIADYISFAGENSVKGLKSDLERKQAELDKLIKEGNPSEQLQIKLEELKAQNDNLLQLKAEYDDWKENDWKGKYEESSQTLSKMKLDVAFSNVKPSFPDTVNKYEANAKWKDFQNAVLDKYEIELDKDGTPIAIDKENKHSVKKLSDLVDKSEEISALKNGKEPEGLGSKKTVKFEGVPFEVPENASNKEKQEAVRNYLKEQNMGVTSPEYASKFAELYKKISGKTPV